MKATNCQCVNRLAGSWSVAKDQAIKIGQKMVVTASADCLGDFQSLPADCLDKQAGIRIRSIGQFTTFDAPACLQKSKEHRRWRTVGGFKSAGEAGVCRLPDFILRCSDIMTFMATAMMAWPEQPAATYRHAGNGSGPNQILLPRDKIDFLRIWSIRYLKPSKSCLFSTYNKPTSVFPALSTNGTCGIKLSGTRRNWSLTEHMMFQKEQRLLIAGCGLKASHAICWLQPRSRAAMMSFRNAASQTIRSQSKVISDESHLRAIWHKHAPGDERGACGTAWLGTRAHIFWLLGPFILLIERSPADLWLSLIALIFAGR